MVADLRVLRIAVGSPKPWVSVQAEKAVGYDLNPTGGRRKVKVRYGDNGWGCMRAPLQWMAMLTQRVVV